MTETLVVAQGSVGAVVVLVSGGRVLLQRRSDFQVWGLPGGHVELGEGFAEAAARELQEETAIEVEPSSLSLVGIYTRVGGLVPDGHFGVFRVEVAAAEPVADETESLELAFFAPSELPEQMIWWHRVMTADALAGASGVARTVHVTSRLPEATRAELYEARERSGMTAGEFFMWCFPPPERT